VSESVLRKALLGSQSPQHNPKNQRGQAGANDAFWSTSVAFVSPGMWVAGGEIQRLRDLSIKLTSPEKACSTLN
jgi:hypothetical protein